MSNSKQKTVQFTGDELIADIMQIMPEAGEILTLHGLACAHCMIGSQESLRNGVLSHGFSEEDLQKIIQDLNEAAEDLGIN